MQREGFEAQIIYLHHSNTMVLQEWTWVNTPIDFAYVFSLMSNTIPVRFTKQADYDMMEVVKTLLSKPTGLLAGW